MSIEKTKPITQDDIPAPYDIFVAIAKANRHPAPDEFATAAARAYDDGVAYPEDDDADDDLTSYNAEL